MGVVYNYNSDSAYSTSGAKGQFKRWFSWRKRYTGPNTLERNPTGNCHLYDWKTAGPIVFLNSYF
jgi:hypothetical protein